MIGVLTTAAVSARQAPNVATRESTMKARVESVERSARLLTLRDDVNTTQSIYVDPSVKAFDQLRPGDMVTVRYVESVVVQVRRDAKPREARDTTEEARKAGKTDVYHQANVVVTVESIDTQGQTLTYRTHDNRKAAHVVFDKKLLEGLRPGDKIEITLTRERAISVQSAR
jgi:hypothetical protein